jgi:surface antigen
MKRQLTISSRYIPYQISKHFFKKTLSSHIPKENRTMKRYSYLLVVAVVGISLAGCMSPQGRQDYTASGALAGGATGAIVGSMARHSVPGAILGGAVGAVVGGLIGHGMDQAQEAKLEAQAPHTLERVEQGQPLTVVDVQSLVKAGVVDDLVISQIRNSRTVYHLSTADIINLKNAGVSERIIDFMINTQTQIQSAEVAGVVGAMSPPPPPAHVTVVAPGPDYVWVGGAWLWLGGRWAWKRGYWHRPMYPHRYRSLYPHRHRSLYPNRYRHWNPRRR